MIHVKRSLAQPPMVLTGKNSKGAKETEKACNYYQHLIVPVVGAKAPKHPKFAAYSHPEVKAALAILFGGKCAYCESRYASTQPVDVEHFRPKGGVAENPAHPGYYWLGAAWKNLLPSCIDCNRQREQLQVADPGQPSVTGPAGKACAFPLDDESKRAKGPNDLLENEQPLLLNPCEDEPRLYLAFTTQGIVQSSRQDASLERRRAEKSIAVYGLNRSGLVLARLETLRLLQARLLTIGRLTKALDLCAAPRKMKLAMILEDLLAHELSEMRAFTLPARPYSQMCSQIIEDFMRHFVPPATT